MTSADTDRIVASLDGIRDAYRTTSRWDTLASVATVAVTAASFLGAFIAFAKRSEAERRGSPQPVGSLGSSACPRAATLARRFATAHARACVGSAQARKMADRLRVAAQRPCRASTLRQVERWASRCGGY